MQREAMQRVLVAPQPVVLALAVAYVADERTRDVLEVAADLMKPAGVRARFDERVATERVLAPDLGLGRDALEAGCAWDRVIDHDMLGRMAARDREIALVGGGPRVAECARGVAIE